MRSVGGIVRGLCPLGKCLESSRLIVELHNVLELVVVVKLVVWNVKEISASRCRCFSASGELHCQALSR